MKLFIASNAVRVSARPRRCDNLTMASDHALFVLLADDHAMMRDGLRSLIEVDWPNARFIEARDEASTRAALSLRPPPELAVIDVRMPGMRGAESFATFRTLNPTTQIVVVTGLDDPGLEPSLRAAGATAVVPKEVSGSALLHALHAALDSSSAHTIRRDDAEPLCAPDAKLLDAAKPLSFGSHRLSERQRETLRLLHEGLPNKLIAQQLGIAETTVKGHLHALYDALSVKSRSEAVAATRDWLL